MSSITADSHAHDAHAESGIGHFISSYVFSLDHKIIGLQFLFSTLLWFLIGGLLALGIRWQLAYPWSNMPILGNILFPNEGGQIAPEFYTVLFTMHATVMIFLRHHPDPRRRIWKLPDSTNDRCRRHGVPDAEHVELLVHVACVSSASE